MQIDRTVGHTSGGVNRLPATSKSRPATGTNSIVRGVTVPTSEIEFTFPSDITTPRELVIQNRDQTNSIQFGFETGLTNLVCQPGGAVTLDINPSHSSVFLIANVATCEATVMVVEE